MSLWRTLNSVNAAKMHSLMVSLVSVCNMHVAHTNTNCNMYIITRCMLLDVRSLETVKAINHYDREM